MNSDTKKALELLKSGGYTCVLCRGDAVYSSRERGIRPLVELTKRDVSGFCAADKIVGRAAAFIYVLLGVKEVYAEVMSRGAAEILAGAGITSECETLAERIINRAGTGDCPMELAVKDAKMPAEALAAVKAKLRDISDDHNKSENL